jgi:glycosyltransferase involved in cell wall biosynthesis
MFQKLRNLADQLAGPALLIGLLGSVIQNYRLWQRDRVLADRLRLDRSVLPQLQTTPRVSVLVAAWNEGTGIDAHIASFLALRYPDIELILCAGGNDDTYARAARYASDRVIVLRQHAGEGKQRALATCFAHATGEFIFLTDADCHLEDEALIRLLDAIINQGEAAATGISQPLPKQAAMVLPNYIWISDAVAAMHHPAYTTGLLGRNALLTRQALVDSGGMDFVAPTGTDYQLGQRLHAANIAIRFVHTSNIASKYPQSWRDYRRRQSRWLRNLLLYGPRYGATADVAATLKTIITGLTMLSLPIAGITIGRIVIFPWLLLVFHAMIAKVRYRQIVAYAYGQPIQLPVLRRILPLTLADFVIWASPVFDMVFRQRRTQW